MLTDKLYCPPRQYRVSARDNFSTPVTKSTGELIVPSAVALPLGEQKYVFCESADVVHNSTAIVNIICFITFRYYRRNKDILSEINVRCR